MAVGLQGGGGGLHPGTETSPGVTSPSLRGLWFSACLCQLDSLFSAPLIVFLSSHMPQAYLPLPWLVKNPRVLLYSTGDSTPYTVRTCMGKEFEKE